MSYSAAARECLAWELRHIAHLLEDPKLTDLHIKGGKGIAFAERGGGKERIEVPYSFADLDYIARLAAACTGQDIAADVPSVSTTLPGGHRVYIDRPPATPDGEILFSIRNPVADAWSLSSMVEMGSMAAEHASAIRGAVLAQHSILFAGLVGSGKTTFLRSALHEAPLDWRLVTIEDGAREIIGLRHENVAHMLFSAGAQSVAQGNTAEALVSGAMRKGMDGLLLQEVKGQEAFAWLSALKSGHWTMSTTHAKSADDAFGRVAGLVKEHPAGMHMDEAHIERALRGLIRLVVYCVRDGARRFVNDVLAT